MHIDPLSRTLSDTAAFATQQMTNSLSEKIEPCSNLNRRLTARPYKEAECKSKWNLETVCLDRSRSGDACRR